MHVFRRPLTARRFRRLRRQWLYQRRHSNLVQYMSKSICILSPTPTPGLRRLRLPIPLAVPIFSVRLAVRITARTLGCADRDGGIRCKTDTRVQPDCRRRLERAHISDVSERAACVWALDSEIQRSVVLSRNQSPSCSVQCRPCQVYRTRASRLSSLVRCALVSQTRFVYSPFHVSTGRTGYLGCIE
jgi:hypothetical protein